MRNLFFLVKECGLGESHHTILSTYIYKALRDSQLASTKMWLDRGFPLLAHAELNLWSLTHDIFAYKERELTPSNFRPVDAFYKNFEIDHKHLQSYTNGKLLALKLKSMGERNSRDNLKNLKIFVRPELSSHGMQENCGFLRPAEQAKEGFFLQFFKSTLKLVGKYIGSGELYRGVSPNNVNDGVNPSSGTVRTKLLSLLSPQAKMACGVYLAMADCKGQQNELSQIMHLILLARQSICYEILRLSSMVLKLSQATPFFGSHPSSRDDHYLGRAFLSVALHVQDCVLTCRAIVAHFFASCNGEQNTSDANPFFLRSKCIAEHPDSLLGLATTAIFTALTLSAWVSGDSLLD